MTRCVDLHPQEVASERCQRTYDIFIDISVN